MGDPMSHKKAKIERAAYKKEVNKRFDEEHQFMVNDLIVKNRQFLMANTKLRWWLTILVAGIIMAWATAIVVIGGVFIWGVMQ
jgi:hypothetical protein